MVLGDGRAVFVADASMAMNLMLPVADNARLFANIFDTTCAQSECRFVVLADDATLSGIPGDGEGTRSEFSPRSTR